MWNGIKASWYIHRLNSGKSWVREEAAILLGLLGNSKAVEPLITALKDVEAKVRSSAAQALGKIGDSQAVQPLLATVDDRSETVRHSIIEALGQLGDPETIGSLIEFLENKRSNDINISKVISKTITSIVSISGKGPNHIRDIVEKLQTRIPEGKNYLKETKVCEFFPIALNFRKNGYDFEITYQEEKSHYERVKDEIVNTEISGVDTGQYMGYGKPLYTSHFASGRTFTYHHDEAWNPDSEISEYYYDKLIIDVPESISISRGNRLN